MMVPHLVPGDLPTAERWNALFEAVDERVDACLDGKNLLFLNPANQSAVCIDGAALEASGEVGGVVGWVHLFAGSGRRWITDGLQHRSIRRPAYDHSIFTQAAATAPIVSIHREFGFMNVRVPTSQYALVGLDHFTNNGDDFFSASLEIFRREHTWTPPGFPSPVTESYYLLSSTAATSGLSWRGASHPGRDQNWSQAEIGFDGQYGGAFTVLNTWRKHDFWRFLNCDNAPVVVTFQAAADMPKHVVTIPPGGSRCVRRDRLPSGMYEYTDGYRHLQRMRPGDLRFVNLGERQEYHNGFPHQSPQRQMVVNNVNNPWIINKYLRIFRERGQSVSLQSGQLLDDDTVQWNAESLLVGAGQYSPIKDALRVADLRYQHGTIIHVSQDPSNPSEVQTQPIRFTGVSSAPAAFAEAGLTFETVELVDFGGRLAPYYRITAPSDGRHHWLVPLSTNLLATPLGTPNRVVRLNPTLQVPLHWPSEYDLINRYRVPQGRYAYNFTHSRSYSLGVSGGGGTYTRSQQYADFRAPLENANGISSSFRPVGRLETIGALRARIFRQTNANHGDWDLVQMMWTGFGPAWVSRYRIHAYLPSDNHAHLRNKMWARGPLSYVVGSSELYMVAGWDNRYRQLHLDGDGLYWTEVEYYGETGLWPTPTNPWYLPGRRGRVTQDMMDGGTHMTGPPVPPSSKGFARWPVGDPVPMLLHEAQSHEIKPDGSDLTVGFLNGSQTSVAIQQVVQRASTPMTGRSVIPMVELPDPLINTHARLSEPGWWEANKARLEQGGLSTQDGGANYTGAGFVMYRKLRLLLFVEYYNNLAAQVNSARWMRPISFRDFAIRNPATGQWHSLHPDEAGVYRSCRPATQYCRVGGPTDFFCTEAGILIRTLQDCPGWQTVLGTAKQFLGIKLHGGEITGRSHFGTSGGRRDLYSFNILSNTGEPDSFFKLYENSSAFSETDIRSAFQRVANGLTVNATSHFWVTIADVQAFARSLGYQLSLEDWGVPMKLSVFERPLPRTPEVLDSFTAEFNLFMNTPSSGPPYFQWFSADGLTDVPPVFNVGDTVDFTGGMDVVIPERPHPVTGSPGDVPWNRVVFLQDPAGDWIMNETDLRHAVIKLADLRPADEALPLLLRIGNSSLQVAYTSVGAPVFEIPNPGTGMPSGSVVEFFNVGLEIAGKWLLVDNSTGEPLPEAMRLNLVDEAGFVRGVGGGGWLAVTRDDLVPTTTNASGRFGEIVVKQIMVRNYAPRPASSPYLWNASRLLKLPTSWFRLRFQNFSGTPAGLAARLSSNTSIYPVDAVPAVGEGELSSEPLEDGISIIEAGEDECHQVIYWRDSTVDFHTPAPEEE